MTTNQPLLEVNHLAVDYLSEGATVHAVTDVSFTLRRGEILGIAGESGCGKSTLVYAITRLLGPLAEITAGEVLYHAASRPMTDGTPATLDLLRLSPKQLRLLRWSELAIVFQSAMNALNPLMTIGAQILDVLRTHQPEQRAAQRQQRAQDLLRMVGIAPDRLRAFPHELSGGMRQRAIIAIALALAPEIIIMDEPTTALDVVVQREILLQIMALREEQRFSVIFITHDLSLLLEIADRIAIMYAGRIVEMADARALHEQPRHPYSYGMLNAFPTLHGPRRAMAGIPGAPPDLRAVPAGCAFHVRCPLAFAPCSSLLPALASPPLALDGAAPNGAVACHLYDAARTAEAPPTNARFAAAYAAAFARAHGTGGH
jgi:peptide/nickel transport system ATP-binding protein